MYIPDTVAELHKITLRDFCVNPNMTELHRRAWSQVSMCINDNKKTRSGHYVTQHISGGKTVTEFKALMRAMESRGAVSRAQAWAIRVCDSENAFVPNMGTRWP